PRPASARARARRRRGVGVGLTVTVLGCCGSYPGPDAACSGYLVDDGATRIWLDAGSGSMANLQHHIALTDVDAVVLSHEHPDHWTDLEGFQVAARWRLERTDVPVYAPEGLRRRTYDPDMPARSEEHTSELQSRE